MKFQNLSVKRLFSLVAIGLVLSMSGITIALFLVTKQTAVLRSYDSRASGETVVLLSQQKPDDTIEIDLDLDELDATSAELKATYQEIKD